MADIVLRDRSGNPVEYPGVERVKLNTTNGETVEFVDPALIPESVEKTIDPDFSGGNIVETPEAGTMFSKVTVNKPATLDPKYIAEGVNIAGIIGTLAAGGGGVVVKTGTYAKDSLTQKVINHNLGVVPDYFAFFTANSSTSNFVSGYSYGEALAAMCGVSQYYRTVGFKSGGSSPGSGYITDNSTTAPISNATETTVNINRGAASSITWIAIGGLT